MTWRAVRVCVATLVATMTSTSVLAQTLGQGGDDGIATWRVVGSLGVCLGLAVVGAYVIRMRGGTLMPFVSRLRGARELKLVESVRLGHQSDLHIVDCAGRRMLIASSPAGIEILDRLPESSRRDILGVS